MIKKIINTIPKLWTEKDGIINYIKWAVIDHRPVTNDIKPIHIIFSFVDHFEPRKDTAKGIRISDDIGQKRWVRDYPALASRHKDFDGRPPQHTWFYPYDYMNMEHLKELSGLTYDGYGEIELHLHHNNDTSESLEEKLRDAVRKYNMVGALRTVGKNPLNTYGFIHGKWALDNCDGTCGVNDEITVLINTGCYADFGLPAQNKCAKTKKDNRIYYAVDDPLKPKSFDTGPDVVAGAPASAGLMMIPGPFRIDWRDWRYKTHPMIEEGEIRNIRLPSGRRIDLWVDTNIHVPGRPDWIFVKLFTHGAVEEDLASLLDSESDEMYSYLEENYNDGNKYKLHYVTARESYNIIKAAEAGMSGDPNLYRDYEIKPYINKLIKSDVLYEVSSCSDGMIEMNILEHDKRVNLEFKGLPLQKISGWVKDMRIINNGDEWELHLTAKLYEDIKMEVEKEYIVKQMETGRYIVCKEEQTSITS